MSTQAEALDRLIAAVEAGVIDGTDNPDYTFVALLPQHRNSARAAYNGGLDAAKALHDALTPFPDVDMECRLFDGLCDVTIYDVPGGDAKGTSIHGLARAWLLAILRAYRGTLV